MAKVTVELSLDQLIAAAKSLSLAERLKLIRALLRDNPLELVPHLVDEWEPLTPASELTDEQLREEVLRLVDQVRTQHQAQPEQHTTPLGDLLADFTTGQDLFFTDLDDDDFQA